MDEREAHWLAVIAASAMPVLVGVAMARLMVARPDPQVRLPPEAVFVASVPPIPMVPEHGVAEPGRRPAPVAPGRDPSEGRSATLVGGAGEAASPTPGAGATLDLSLPERGMEFGTSVTSLTGDWDPALPRMRLRMADNSFGGRLARMQKGAVCNELKLKAGMPVGAQADLAPDRESLVREMAELGCLK